MYVNMHIQIPARRMREGARAYRSKSLNNCGVLDWPGALGIRNQANNTLRILWGPAEIKAPVRQRASP